MEALPFEDDAGLDLARAATNDVSGADVAYCKFMTPNDTGETHSHQAGLHIAKLAWSLLFDLEGVKGSNMDRHWEIRWNGVFSTQSRAIYYGQGTRNEYRLTRLGPGFPFRGAEHTGDLLVMTRRRMSERLNAWVLEDEASIEEFLGAFALSPENTNQLMDVSRARPLVASQPAPDDRVQLISEFVRGLPEGWFPSTREISAAARTIDLALHPGTAPGGSPDAIIKRWADLEYAIFRAVEESVHGDAVAEGFESVEDFVQLANTILNRRKSRAGHSLENHLAAIFESADIEFTEQPTTEGRRRPDFVFPSEQRYHDESWPASRLVFLAAKTTCKDRWRQILNEADRIPHKHLFTLQQGISAAQLEEMSGAGVTLVVPAANKDTFPAGHRDWILSLQEFLELVREVTSS